MKCIIPGPNIRVLGRAIWSLAKFGEDLYVESTEKELHFRTVNLSQTAYASYSFSSIFFTYFNFESNKNESITCQISMRSALSVFKSSLTLDKTTESVQIEFQPNCDKIVFTVKHSKGVIKTFNVPVIECEVLKAYYQKDSSPNSVTIQPKIAGEILANFQNSQDEITWKVTKSNIIIKNFTEPDSDCKRIRTEICVDMDEFDNFKVENETEITFCLKELKAVLAFSDNVSLPLTANFSTCSKPIVFIIKNDTFEVNIVVSTLSGDDNISFQSQDSPKINGDPEVDEEVNSEADTEVKSDVQEVGVADNTISRREKLKRVFQRCFNTKSYNLQNLPGYDVVLASDSESDS